MSDLSLATLVESLRVSGLDGRGRKGGTGCGKPVGGKDTKTLAGCVCGGVNVQGYIDREIDVSWGVDLPIGVRVLDS